MYGRLGVSDVTDAILAFLRSIGIEVRESTLEAPTFLPGITIERGVLLYDPVRLQYPGDLLHEAGHIAFTPARDRRALSAHATGDLGEEIAAIAWSYAALVHLGIDPAIVFHEGGYRGSSRAFIENFATGHYAGVPMLAWAGMAAEKTRGTTPEIAYPRMLQWLRGDP